MSSARTLARRAVNQCYALVGRVTGVEGPLVGVREFNERYRKGNTLFVMAPGASIRDFNRTDFDEISREDSVGLSSFVAHWYRPSFWLFETHPTGLGLIDCLGARRGEDCVMFYRGYSSPGKFADFISNLRRLRRIGGVRVRMLKDRYVRDLGAKKTIADAITLSQEDGFFNYVGSVTSCLYLGYSAGYSNIVLCGVDCSQDYFFHDEIAYPIQEPKPLFTRIPNLLSTDPRLVAAMTSSAEIVDGALRRERSGGVFHLHGRGPLASKLRTFVRPTR